MQSSWYETPSLQGSGQCTCASGCWKMPILPYARRLRWPTCWRLLCTTLTLSSHMIPCRFRECCRPRHPRANPPPLLPLASPQTPRNQPQLLPVASPHSVTSADSKSTPENAARPEKLLLQLWKEGPFRQGLKSATGTTLPALLTSPGPVLLRKHVRSNKYSPLVERAHLLHANPQYAYVVLPDGQEDMVSIRDLAPTGAADHYPKHSTVTMNPVPVVTPRTPSPTQTPHDTSIPGALHVHIPGASHTHEGSLTPSGLTPPVRPEPAQPPTPV
ncbi:uncharacterized protein LOC132403433 [Hypanus sabinus]|uniref:uncharacterized protein LOC132403433 n=1 Tax=Hypanus sabinus TaxID=79690 RepID=UPI0028C3A07B|nr:uncharacterized protein LOC132403433 [Hypanus sabinus]